MILFILYFSSATSTATSLSSTTNTGNLYENSQTINATESPVNSPTVPSKESRNGHSKNGSGGRSKDGGRPDLLAMTPSRNASLNSNSGSPVPHLKSRTSRCYESRLKDHINQLKAERASLQQQSDVQQLSHVLSSFNLNIDDFEEASNVGKSCKETDTKKVLLNKIENGPEIQSNGITNNIPTSTNIAKEREADLQAQMYLINQEKRSLEMKLDDRHSLESMLRSHIEHLREENDRLSRGEGRLTSLSREDKLGKRVDSLLDTLDRVTKNSEQRQIHSDELMGDLKRANRYVKIVMVNNATNIVVLRAFYFHRKL